MVKTNNNLILIKCVTYIYECRGKMRLTGQSNPVISSFKIKMISTINWTSSNVCLWSWNRLLLTQFTYRMLKTQGQLVSSLQILRIKINFTWFMVKLLSVMVFFFLFDDNMAYELRSVSLSAEWINAFTLINSLTSSE